jgi:hypothetical protein
VYKITPTKDQLRMLKDGDRVTILKLLRESDKNVIQDLKKNTTIDMAYLKGISQTIDRLIELLEMPS